MDGISASIVIPVHNGGNWLRRCLESVLAQTRGDFEVICVDNGSTDDSLGVLEEFARKDPRVTALSEARPGVSCARNAGMARARGEYHLFVDADDTVEPTLVERVVGEAEKNDADLVVYSFDACYEDPRAGFPQPPCPCESLYGTVFSARDLDVPATLVVTPNVWRIAFRASYVRSLELTYPEDLRTSEDLVFVYRALLPAERVVALPDLLYHYSRDSAGSLTRGDREGAGVAALGHIRDALAVSADERWLRYQLTNLVLDTFEYQLGTCATVGEYHVLLTGLRREWLGYVTENAELVHERYQRFFSLVQSTDPLENLFAQHVAARSEAEYFRVWDQAHKQELTACHERIGGLEEQLRAEREQAAATQAALEGELRAERERADATRAELDAVYASRSWRFARALAKVVHGGRA